MPFTHIDKLAPLCYKKPAKKPLCRIIEGFSAWPSGKASNVLATGLVLGSVFFCSNANAVSLHLSIPGDTVVEEPNSGTRTVSMNIVKTVFAPGNEDPAWSNGTCTITGEVAVRTVEPDGEIVYATEGTDFAITKSSFSITVNPVFAGEGPAVFEAVADQITFEIYDDNDEEEALEEYIDIEITSYGASCESGATPTLSRTEDYGAFILRDPFDEKEVDPAPGEPVTPSARSKAIPVRHASLTKQLNALRNLTLHTAQTRDKSIAREIDRARSQSGFNVQNLQVNVGGQALPGNALLGGAAGDGDQGSGPWGFFVSGSIDIGEQDSNTDFSSDFDASLLIAGLDYRINDNIVLGGALSHTQVEAGDNTLAKTEFDRTSLALFASLYSADTYYVNAILTQGSTGYDLNRKIDTDTAAKDSASADTDGDETSVSVGAGYNFPADNLNLRVFSFINYINADIDSYTESVTGDSSAASVGGMDLKSVTADFGLELSGNLNTGIGVFVPSFALSHQQQWADDSVTVNGQFIGGIDAGEFEYTGPDRDRHYLNARVGVSAVLPHGISAYLAYETQFQRDDFESNHTTAGVRWEF
jgi:outer membrane autotransporter protein